MVGIWETGHNWRGWRGGGKTIQAGNYFRVAGCPPELAVMVDTSGYSSDVQQKYQAYLISEIPIAIEGHALPAGVYGVGFVADNKFVVLDVGAHDLFSVSSHKDEALKRPMPLKVTADGGSFRLYAGRNYVSFAR